MENIDSHELHVKKKKEKEKSLLLIYQLDLLIQNFIILFITMCQTQYLMNDVIVHKLTCGNSKNRYVAAGCAANTMSHCLQGKNDLTGI